MGDLKYEMDEYGNVKEVSGSEGVSGGSAEDHIAALKQQLCTPPAADCYESVKKSLSTAQADNRSIDDAAGSRRIMSSIPVLSNSGAENNKKIPFKTLFALSCPAFILFMFVEEYCCDYLLIRSYGAGYMVIVPVVCSFLFSLFIFFACRERE